MTYDTSKMGERFKDAMTAAGMGDRYGRDDGITFHSYRHTFATRCAAAGVPAADAAGVARAPRLEDGVDLRRLPA